MRKFTTLLILVTISISMICCNGASPKEIDSSLRVTALPEGYFVPKDVVFNLKMLYGAPVVEALIAQYELRRLPVGFHITPRAMEILAKAYAKTKRLP